MTYSLLYVCPVLRTETPEHMVSKIPALRLLSNTDLDTAEALCAGHCNDALNPIVTASTALFADTDTPRLKRNIIKNNDHFLIRIKLIKIHHLSNRLAA